MRTSETNILTIPLLKIDRWRRVSRLYPYDARLHLGRRTEVVLPHLHEVIDARQELRVDGQAAIQFVAGLRHEPLRKLSLQFTLGSYSVSHPTEIDRSQPGT